MSRRRREHRHRRNAWTGWLAARHISGRFNAAGTPRRHLARAVWVAVIVLVAVCCVLSSGPTRVVAVQYSPAAADENPHATVDEPLTSVEVSHWWQTLYAPLGWAANRPWGQPLNWYWNLFPIIES